MPAIPSGIIVAWPGSASIPTNWSRVTSLDAKYVKSTTGSPAPNNTGGNANHVHDSAAHTHSGAHTHASTTISASDITGGNNYPQIPHFMNSHTHSVTIPSGGATTSSVDHGNWSCAANDPAKYTVRWIQSNGNPTGFPNTSIAWYNNATAPDGWSQHTATRDYFLVGAASGANGGSATAGASHTHTTGAHTHTAPNHTHPGGSFAWNQNNPPGGSINTCGCVFGGAHTWYPHSGTTPSVPSSGQVTTGGVDSGTSGGTTYEPQYHTLLGIENDSGSDNLIEGLIVGWLGTIGNIPEEWVLCDGNNDTPNLNGKFIKAANATSEVGDTGGTDGHQNSSGGHSHNASHTHNVPSFTFTSNYWVTETAGSTSVQNGSRCNPHTHPSSTTSVGGAAPSTSPTLSATADTQPPFRTIAWLQYQPSVVPNVMFFGANS